jgi:nucleoside-diphosphate-sugar epimerase
MEKIVITGATSFIGMHLAKYFAQKNYDVIATISHNRLKYQGIKLARLEELEKYNIKIVELDIKDPSQLETNINLIKPDYWIQHAGWAEKYGSFDYDLAKSFEINAIPLNKLYELLVEVGAKGVLLTGSSAEYPDLETAALENDNGFPTMPYGLSKLVETIYAAQLAKRYQLSTRIIRVFIPYGEFDNPNKLFSSVYRSLSNNQTIDLSPCTQKRDFIYIDDLLAGYYSILKDSVNRTQIFDIFNICSGEAIPLKELLLTMAAALKVNKQLLNFGAIPMREGEPLISYGNNDKAKRVLNWVPNYTLEKGIQALIQNEKY